MGGLIKRVARVLRLGQRARQVRQQSGYVVISLATIGLFGAAAGAVPVLNRVVGSLNASETTPANQSGAACAAEHALWRLENDPSIWSSMSGTPPTYSYQTPACGVLTDADVEIEALDNPPTGDDRFEVALTVEPDTVPTDSDEQFTYTVTVTNNDIVPHYIDRVIINPRSWGSFKPVPVSGTTTGITTDDPQLTGFWCGSSNICDFQWDLYPYVEVPAFGGEVELSLTAEENLSWGSYWSGAEVRFNGIGTIYAPNSARVRFQDNDALVVEQFVTPEHVSAGNNTTYYYTIRARNTGASDISLDWVRAWMDTDFSYKFGSTEFDGSLYSDPTIWSPLTLPGWVAALLEGLTFDSRARYFWNLPPTTINPGSFVDLTYQVQGSLEPGVYFSRASGLIHEAPGGSFFGLLDLSTSTTGETAPVEVHQGFSVTATHEGTTVIVTGTVGADGIDVLSWQEF